MEGVKLVVVGDVAVGKSTMIIVYTTNTFPNGYIPTVYNDLIPNVMVDGKAVCLGLWDTAGQEEFDRDRPLAYPQTSVFLLCYSVENRSSFENIKLKWLPELRHHAPGVPIVLVGCKVDLRHGSSKGCSVSYDEGLELANEENMRFCETSSLTNYGLKECFDEAMRTALRTNGGRIQQEIC